MPGRPFKLDATALVHRNGVYPASNPPTADFSYSPSTPSTAQSVDFTDLSYDPNNDIESWSWDFGDGATSTVQNPSHSFSSADSFNVTLTVTDSFGNTDSATKQISVVSAAFINEDFDSYAHKETPNGFTKTANIFYAFDKPDLARSGTKVLKLDGDTGYYAFSEEKQLSTSRMYFAEPSNNETGSGFAYLDGSGNTLFGWASGNPAWWVFDASGWTQLYSGASYEEWIRVEFLNFDWTASPPTFELEVEDTSTGTLRTHQGTCRTDAAGAAKLQFRDSQGGNWTNSNSQAWYDDMYVS